jgi:hypothetical protein
VSCAFFRALSKGPVKISQVSFVILKNTQDILSAFYYLRNYPTIDNINPGESIVIDMFFDDETTKFKLKFIGRENITTKFELYLQWS